MASLQYAKIAHLQNFADASQLQSVTQVLVSLSQPYMDVIIAGADDQRWVCIGSVTKLHGAYSNTKVKEILTEGFEGIGPMNYVLMDLDGSTAHVVFRDATSAVCTAWLHAVAHVSPVHSLHN